MTLAVRRVDRWFVDPKRVFAWSGVLLLHTLILGAVLLPRAPMSPILHRVVDAYIPVEFAPPPDLPLPPPVLLPPPPLNLVVPRPSAPPVAPTPTPMTTTSEIVLTTAAELPVLPQAAESAAGVPATAAAVLLTLKALSAPPPAYPRRLLARGIGGSVELRVLVAIDGSAQTVEVIGGSGNRELEMAAIRSVKRWRFQPHSSNGVPQAAWARVPLVFRVDN